MIRSRTLGTGLLLAALTTSLALTVRHDGYYTDPVGLACRYGACWLLFAAAVWCLRKVPVRHAVALILGGSVIVAATGLLAPPAHQHRCVPLRLGRAGAGGRDLPVRSRAGRPRPRPAA